MARPTTGIWSGSFKNIDPCRSISTSSSFRISTSLLWTLNVASGFPNKNPWSLPFAHKRLFAERADKYDLFIYSEDDILITERNIRAFLDVTAALQPDEIAGFLRFEQGANGEKSYPDIHENFHWDSTSVRVRSPYTLAHFTNAHAACYVLTQSQLKMAIQSGGFLVDPHEELYDLLCTAATDPYTQCGIKKLVPVSHIDDFTVHHASNKYVGRVGITKAELVEQIDALIRIAERMNTPRPLFNTETKLPRGHYSKDYYEPISEDVMSAIPRAARNVLSIGCASGATETKLIERGLRVVALPLDPVVSGGAAARGVEMIHGSINEIATLTRGEKFDCVLCLNVLHLAHDPERVLSKLMDCLCDNSTLIVQSPNMLSLSHHPADFAGYVRASTQKGLFGHRSAPEYSSSREALVHQIGNEDRSNDRGTESPGNKHVWQDYRPGRRFPSNVSGDLLCNIRRGIGKTVAGCARASLIADEAFAHPAQLHPSMKTRSEQRFYY